jgi:hypothetical protein
MHIGFRTSGGRGEYELVGGASGQSAGDLEGWTFSMRWPDGLTRDTNLWLDPGESGKPRLRSLVTPPYQIGRMIAAMLLLPDPRRERRSSGENLPVAQKNRYVITRIGFGPETSFASPPEAVEFDPNYVELSNQKFADLIGVDARWSRIAEVHAATDRLHSDVAARLARHRETMAAGEPITRRLTLMVDALIQTLARVDAQYQLGYDPLPALARLAGIGPPGEPLLPPPDEIGEDEIDVRLRSAQEYRLSRMRGSAARKFATAVREAYKHRCLFCGVVLGGVPGVVSGIDAAHILAWSSYDLDVVGNGMALCRTHHWAFDAGLMTLVVEKGVYRVRFTQLAEHFDKASLEHLGTDGFVIPDEWLPSDTTLRPSPKYLTRLHEDVSLSI